MAPRTAPNRVPFAPLLSARGAGTLAFVWWPLSGLVADLVHRAGVAPCARDALSVLLAYAVARFAFAERFRWAITVRLALWAFVASLLVSATFVFFDVLHGKRPSTPAQAAFAYALITSLFFRCALFGCYAGVLGWIVGHHVEEETSEGADLAGVNAAAWMLVVTVVLALGGATAPWALVVFWALKVVAPGAWGVAALVRIRARRRWVAAVARGALPGWRLVESSPGTQGLPRLARVASGQTRTLVRVHDATQPFREAESQEAVALVALR
jgi:hypothetical protein